MEKDHKILSQINDKDQKVWKNLMIKIEHTSIFFMAALVLLCLIVSLKKRQKNLVNSQKQRCSVFLTVLYFKKTQHEFE